MDSNEYIPLLPLETRSATTSSNVISKGAKGAVVSLHVEVIPSGSLLLHVYGYDRVSNQTYTVLDSAAIAASGTTALSVYPGITASNNVAKSGVLPYDWKVEVAHTPSNLIARYSVGVSLID